LEGRCTIKAGKGCCPKKDLQEKSKMGKRKTDAGIPCFQPSRGGGKGAQKKEERQPEKPWILEGEERKGQEEGPQA
jgi:hypothetical protein